MYEPIVIALSGHKGSGKNTLAHSISLWYNGHIRGRGSKTGVFAFADGIKEFCIDILGLEHEQCYGSDDDKNTSTKYKWEGTPKWPSRQGQPEWRKPKPPPWMTGREVMQVFGTECIRVWFGNVWAEATIRKIRKQGLHFALVTDNRFPDEIETILGQPRGYIIRLTRSPFDGDKHESEIALDDFEWCRPHCFVLDNARMSKSEQNDAVIPILKKIFQQGAGV